MTPAEETWRPEGTTATDYKKSDGWDREKRKTKIQAREDVPLKSETQRKKIMYDKVLSLCVRLIMEVDNLKSGPLLAVLGLFEKADCEDSMYLQLKYELLCQ